LVGVLLVFSVAVALAVHDEGLFELGDDLGTPGSADIAGDGNQSGPDWADIFGSGGNVDDLHGGLAAEFIADEISSKQSSDPTTFESRNKNSDPISSWEWGAGGVASKGELSNFYVYATSNASNLIIYAGLERVDPGGDTHVDIELNQASVAPLTCGGSPCGFSGQRTLNDVLLVMDYTKGGDLGVVEVRVWNGSTWDPIGNPVNNEGCSTDDIICGFNNGSSFQDSSWQHYLLDHNQVIPTDNVERNAFTELGVNVTQLLAQLPEPNTTPCFRSVQAKTRSSSSFDSTLLDFAMTPIDLCQTRISIDPLSAANQVGQPHVFTATVETLPSSNGFVWGPVDNADASFTTSGVGSLSSPTCTTDGTGTCTVALTSTITGRATVSATTAVAGTGLTQASAPATRSWVDARLTLTQDEEADQIGNDHVITASLEFDYGDGSGFVSAPDGETINLLTDFGSLSAPSCNTDTATFGAGNCQVILTSDATGPSNVSASWNGNIVTTADGAASAAASAGPVTNQWVDALLSLESDSSSGQIGEPVTITATLEFDYGDGGGVITSTDGLSQTITFAIVPNPNGVVGPGSFNGNGQQTTCTTGTDSTCTVTFSSDKAGTTTISASWQGDVSVNQIIILGSADFSITQYSADARLTLQPSSAAIQVGNGHLITASLAFTNGVQWYQPPDNEIINFSTDFGTLSSNTCLTLSGQCSVTLQSITQTGVSTVSADWLGAIPIYDANGVPVVVDGTQLSAAGTATATAVSRWVTGTLVLSPDVSASQVQNLRPITADLKLDYGYGPTSTISTTVPVSFTLVGPGYFGSDPTSMTTSTTCLPVDGTCSVTLRSTQTGTSTVAASWSDTITTAEGTVAISVTAQPAIHGWVNVSLSAFNASTCTTAEAAAFEPNDTMTDTHSINVGVPYAACVTADEQHDFYSLVITEPVLFTVTLTGLQTDVDLAVFTTGGLIQGADYSEFDGSTDLEATARQGFARQGFARQGFARQGFARQGFARQGFARQGFARQGFARQGFARQGFARQGFSLLGAGVSFGAVDERVVAVAAQPGTYYVSAFRSPDALEVDGRYTLQVEVEGIDTGSCTWPYPDGTSGTIFDGSSIHQPQTLILTHQGRLEAIYGAARASSVISKLQQLAALDSVRGIVIPVDTDPSTVLVPLATRLGAVQGAYGAWNANYCNVQAANSVASAIRDLIQGYVDDSINDIQYVVIAGSDEIIPFYRVPDEVQIANERDFALFSATDASDSPLFWAMAQGYILTQDFYVDDDPALWRGRELYIPDRAIGRLVETPEEMITVINNYQNSSGTTNVSNCLATGYDFVTDATDAITSILQNFGTTVNSDLNDDWWTAADLVDAWSLASVKPDLVSVNGHFEHWNAVPATGSSLFTNADITGSDNISNTIAYSVGCHAGLNVPDSSVFTGAVEALGGITGTVTSPDFPQAFAQRGAAAWVANTGYGYGMDDAIADSERLAVFFSQQLGADKPVAVGQALVNAKKRFADDTGAGTFNVYAEKSMIEATLYGLPMHQVSMPVTQTLTTVGGGSALTPTALSSFPTYSTLTVDLPATERSTKYQGTYWSIGDGVSIVPGYPLQPSAVVELEDKPGLVPAGVLLTSASYTDFAGRDPVAAIPSPEFTLPEPSVSLLGWLPARFWSLNPSGKRVVLIGGQTNTDGPVQRIYNQVVLEAHYAPQNTSSEEPVVLDVYSDDTGVTVAVDGGTAGVQRVLVTYNDPDSSSWQKIEAFQDPDRPELWWAWTGNLSSDTQYFVQVLGNNGQVAVDSNRGLYYLLEPRASYAVGTQAKFTVELKVDKGDGNGPQVADDGTTGFTLLVTGGTIDSETCNTTGTVDGKCDVVVNPTGTGTGTVQVGLQVGWQGPINVNVSGAGSSQLVVVPATVNVNQIDLDFWTGSIALPKNVQVNALAPNPNICFGLSRADGGPLVSTNPAQQCFDFSAAQSYNLFQWEGLEAGTYVITETVPTAYAPLASATGTVLFADIVLDDAHQNWVLSTVQNVPANEGCTPGYWRNHLDEAILLGFQPDASFNATFQVSYPGTSPLLDSVTLEDAVNSGGGGLDKLARHGTAALFSAQSGIYYPYTVSEVLDLVQTGLAGDPEPEATQLADANNLGCPLN
jgi:hypothetical protein